jgi:hypothetical protein
MTLDDLCTQFYGGSLRAMAADFRIDRTQLRRIMTRRQGITPDMARRLWLLSGGRVGPADLFVLPPVRRHTTGHPALRTAPRMRTGPPAPPAASVAPASRRRKSAIAAE